MIFAWAVYPYFGKWARFWEPTQPMEISMALQDRLDAFKADFRSGRPPYNVTKDRIDIMDRATAELIASGQAQRASKAGDIAPEFLLRDADGKEISSRELIARGPLVI